MTSRPASVALALAALAALFACANGPREVEARGDVPIGMYGVNNQVMNTGRYLYALRFVLDRDTTVSRFYSGFNLEGTDYLEAEEDSGRLDRSRDEYAEGDGGLIRARLVRVRADGEPDLRRVLAEEVVRPTDRYREIVDAFDIPDDKPAGLLYFELGDVRLRRETPYAMVYQNVHRDPDDHWFSINSPTVKASEAGPNGTNTTRARASGSILGLDPREAVAWSRDRGASWVWGRRVGEGDTPGAYAGSRSGDQGARLPWYGWQTAGGATVESKQPYYAYGVTGNYELRITAPAPVVLRRAGGYAHVDDEVGRVTVRNTSTDAEGETRALGSGIVAGRLDRPVPVAAGETYEITHTGDVAKQEGDEFIRRVFGAALPDVETVGDPFDRAQLFALP